MSLVFEPNIVKIADSFLFEINDDKDVIPIMKHTPTKERIIKTSSDEENEDYLHRDYKMRFNGVKNENLAAQLMIHANEHIDSFDFKLPELKSESGDTIPSSAMTVGAEWYQEVTASKEIEAYSGYYADAIIPLANYKFRRLDQIEKGRNQGLFFNIFISEDAKPGFYKGNGTLTLDDQTYTVPFEFTIHDAALPNEEHLRSCFLIWYELIGNGEGKYNTPELHDKYYDFLVSKRIAPGYFPDKHRSSDPVEFANYFAEKVAKDPMISNYRLIEAGTSDGFRADRCKEYLNALIAKNIQMRQAGDNEVNFFKKIMFYLDDEPTPERYDLVRKHDKEIFDLKRELSWKLAEYPDLKYSFEHMQNLVTVQYNDQLVATNEKGGVQCWCPQLQNFQSPESRATYLSRKTSTDRDFSEDVWWYMCESPNNPYPNYHLDGKLLYTRTVKYMQYDYSITGEVHWNICYYSKFTGNFTTSRDIWYDPLSWAKCNGDGQLCYPGKDFGIEGPITTLRLESIMNANEEYEYQWMINEKVQEYNEAHGENLDTIQLMQKYYNKMFTNMKTTCTDTEFNEVRGEIINLVELLYKNLEAGIAELKK